MMDEHAFAKILADGIKARLGAAISTLSSTGIRGPRPIPDFDAMERPFLDAPLEMARWAGEAIAFSGHLLSPDDRRKVETARASLWAIFGVHFAQLEATERPSAETIAQAILSGTRLRRADEQNPERPGDLVWGPERQAGGRPTGMTYPGDLDLLAEAEVRLRIGETPSDVWRDLGGRAAGGGTLESRIKRLKRRSRPD